MTKRLASTCVLVLVATAFAGSAYAGDGKGNGKDKTDTAAVATEASVPGHSASAPGQLKNDDVAAASAPSTPATTTTTTTTTTAAPAGFKPSSTTAEDAHEQASSNKTKLYGNGKTAGQIAIGNGATPSTVLHGPGNSQPHKASPCTGGHEVDVHALKGERLSNSCGGSTPGSGGGGSNSGGGSNTSGGSEPTSTVTGGGDPGSGPAGNPSEPKGSPAKPAAGNPSAGVDGEGVLGSVELTGPSKTLPFTGFPLWVALILGLALITAGLVLLRRAEPTD
jgi:hypothetical protein